MTRRRFDFVEGTLGAALAAASSGDLGVLDFGGVPALPTIASPDYVVLVIDGAIVGRQEITHLVSYTAGAFTGQVLRGEEGTAAPAHDVGAAWACAPTVDDFVFESGFVWNQQVASALWTITHDLPRNPAVTVVDSAGGVVIGDVAYPSDDTVTLTFAAPFSGVAYLT